MSVAPVAFSFQMPTIESMWRLHPMGNIATISASSFHLGPLESVLFYPPSHPHFATAASSIPLCSSFFFLPPLLLFFFVFFYPYSSPSFFLFFPFRASIISTDSQRRESIQFLNQTAHLRERKKERSATLRGNGKLMRTAVENMLIGCKREH